MQESKNSGKEPEKAWRNNAIFVSCLLMLLSLLLTRVALSISSILFFCLCLLHRHIINQLKAFFQSTYLVSFSLLFFIPFLSGLWSSDVKPWEDVVRIKLPLLFFPLAFAGSWKLSSRQWQWIAYLFLVVVTAGCIWSLIYYLQNAADVKAQYLKAKTLPTILENDHVRFSWMVSVAAMLCVLLAKLTTQKKVKWLLYFLLACFIVYLHVLSARTGLISLYLFLFFYIIRKLVRLKKTVWSIAVVLTIIALPLMAYWLLPTFNARVQYIVYDASFIQKNEYLPGSNDGARMMSLKAGWQVLSQHPMGAGAGDIKHEADKWYAAHVPQVISTDKFFPCSEWLMYGGFAGWPGVILFTAIMVFPLFLRVRNHRMFWIAFHATAAFSFAFDIGIDVQYGVFLYSFISMWWWKWLNEMDTERQIIF